MRSIGVTPMKRLISRLLARILLVLALLVPNSLAEAKNLLNFCNVGNTTLFVAMVGHTGHGTIALEGWRQVQVGDCGHVTVTFHSVLGFAVVDANGHKGMQVYDESIAANPAFIATETSYCVDPDNNFHRESKLWKECVICEPGEVPARFAFHVKPKTDETLTLRIPADNNGEIFPLIKPPPLPPFDPATWVPTPKATFEMAMRGLAEQQERLGLRIERSALPPTALWRAYYIRELGAVLRPETHAASVIKGSPADKAGILRGDEIVRFDDIDLNSAWHVRGLLARTRPGEMHTVAFLHGGQLHMATITLQTLPDSLAAADLHPEQGWLGIEFESAARVAGVIYRDGTAHLELDDDIQKIGRTDFDGVDGLAEWLARNQETARVELQVWRRSAGRVLVMTLDKLH
jgi:hypothetical protein